jgi:hypothetical protein
MWDATAQSGLRCVVCKTLWEAVPEWDQSSLIRKVWVIESRWRIGFGYGHWQHVLQLSFDKPAEEVESILERYRGIERRRCVRFKPTMSFEFRAIEDIVEVYRPVPAEQECVAAG